MSQKVMSPPSQRTSVWVLAQYFLFSHKANGTIVGTGLYLLSSGNSEHIHLDLLSRPSLWELLLLSVLHLPVSKRCAFLPAKPKQWAAF